MPALDALNVTATVPAVVFVIELCEKLAGTFVQAELDTALPGARANRVLKLLVVIDWFTTTVLLPAAAVTSTQ